MVWKKPPNIILAKTSAIYPFPKPRFWPAYPKVQPVSLLWGKTPNQELFAETKFSISTTFCSDAFILAKRSFSLVSM